MARYSGFDTRTFLATRSFTLTDKDLINRDIENNIYTKFGERPHLPNFGSSIPTMAFEGLSDELITSMREELTAIIANEPRVTLTSLAIIPDTDSHSLVVLMDLIYNTLNLADTFRIQYDMG